MKKYYDEITKKIKPLDKIEIELPQNVQHIFLDFLFLVTLSGSCYIEKCFKIFFSSAFSQKFLKKPNFSLFSNIGQNRILVWIIKFDNSSFKYFLYKLGTTTTNFWLTISYSLNYTVDWFTGKMWNLKQILKKVNELGSLVHWIF